MFACQPRKRMQNIRKWLTHNTKCSVKQPSFLKCTTRSTIYRFTHNTLRIRFAIIWDWFVPTNWKRKTHIYFVFWKPAFREKVQFFFLSTQGNSQANTSCNKATNVRFIIFFFCLLSNLKKKECKTANTTICVLKNCNGNQ